MLLTSLLWLVLFLGWVLAIVVVVKDLSARRDTGRMTKILWVSAVVVFPFVGTIVYLVARQHRLTRGVGIERTPHNEFPFETDAAYEENEMRPYV